MLTFTNAGRAETEDRLVEMFDAETMSSENRRRVKRRAKTAHGAACSAAVEAGAIDDVTEQVIAPATDTDVYRRFCDRHGLTYARRENNPLKIAYSGRSVEHSGNQLLGINEWLSLTRRPADHLMRAPLTRPADPRRTKALLEAWDEFKRDGDANGRAFGCSNTPTMSTR